jgi:hypothetical protein
MGDVLIGGKTTGTDLPFFKSKRPVLKCEMVDHFVMNVFNLT